MDIAALEEIAARLRSGANCADEAADLIDDAIAELERLHRSVMVEKQWRQDAGDDAKRYRWLRDHLGETPLNPRGFASEICPDIRLKWELPTLVSTTCIGGMVSFDEAIDLAMAHTHNDEAHRKDAAGGLSGGAGCSASDATGERRLK